MATIKGAIRSYGAAIRSIEREQKRKARETARRFKEQQKLQSIENASRAVEDYNNYIETLQSVHKYCTETINWLEIEKQEKPIKPENQNKYERQAKSKLEKFKPSLFDKILGSTSRKIKVLENNIQKAIEKDKELYNLNLNNYKKDLTEWEELHEIAKGVLNYDGESFKKALQYFDPFSDIGELGSKIELSFSEKVMDIDLHVNSLEIIPDYELKQTSTGKVSKKNMTKSKFNELYQDHICSVLLRISREIFAYLPMEYIRINAISELLNSKTGYMEKKPILSVIIPPTTIHKLNMEFIDPSDSMQNFVHNMNFNKTTGFKEVEKVELDK